MLRFIEKPVICFAEQNKWLVSTWNATLDWNGYPIWCRCSHLFYKCYRILGKIEINWSIDTKWVTETLNDTSNFFIFFDWDVKLLECFSNCFSKLLCNTSNLEQKIGYWNLEFTIETLHKPFLTKVPFHTPWKRQRIIGFQE